MAVCRWKQQLIKIILQKLKKERQKINKELLITNKKWYKIHKELRIIKQKQ
jgi:hypothetical protein